MNGAWDSVQDRGFICVSWLFNGGSYKRWAMIPGQARKKGMHRNGKREGKGVWERAHTLTCTGYEWHEPSNRIREKKAKT